MGGAKREAGEMVESDIQVKSFVIPLPALLQLAGVQYDSPQIARCLLVDPPPAVIDAVADWVLDAAISGSLRPRLFLQAISIRISAIDRIRAERDRLTLRFLTGGLAVVDAVALADNWIDYGTSDTAPDRPIQSAIHFGNSAQPGADLVGMLSAGRIRELLYIGEADWVTDISGGWHRSLLIEHLTLQAHSFDERVQLLKFELRRNRPSRAVLHPVQPDDSDRWSELAWWEETRRGLARAGGSNQELRINRWKAVTLPRPLGYDEAPWPLVSGEDGRLLERLDRHYGRLRPEDVSLGTNLAVDPAWLTDSDNLGPDEARPYAALKNLRGSAEAAGKLDRIVWTRDARNEVRPLDQLSYELRGWIFDRTVRFATLVNNGSLPEQQWWASPRFDIPQSDFVALPVYEEHGQPTVLAAGTVTSPGILWFEPHQLSAEVCAALLTSGPVRDQIRILSPRDNRGRSALSLEVLLALRLPRRIHPYIEADLVAAYQACDVKELNRLGYEIYTGNERALLNARPRETPSLFRQHTADHRVGGR